jgi:hypothetical protein
MDCLKLTLGSFFLHLALVIEARRAGRAAPAQQGNAREPPDVVFLLYTVSFLVNKLVFVAFVLNLLSILQFLSTKEFFLSRISELFDLLFVIRI